jgi:DNA-binding NarL/FixJ family response regulator
MTTTPPDPRAVVLIASESRPTRVGMRLALGGDVECTEAADGPSAVEEAVRRRPDVCLLDLQPWSLGLRTTTEIATRVPSSAVIVFTPTPDQAELVAALRAGAAGYLPHSFDPSRLHGVVRAAIDGEIAVPRRYVRWLADEVRERGRRRRLVLQNGSSVSITEREREIVDLLRRRLTTRQIADRLDISPVTVRRHLGAVERKLGVATRAALLQLLE